MKRTDNKAGFTIVEALLILIFLAIVSFAGYYVFHAQHTTSKSQISTPNKSAVQKTTGSTSPKFVDYGKSGITLTNSTDVDKLTGASQPLKIYLTSLSIGSQVQACGSGGCNDNKVTKKVIIYATYGDYANGYTEPGSAASIWGPTATGSIGEVLGFQQVPSCTSLRDAKLPAGFHMTCTDEQGETTAYNG